MVWYGMVWYGMVWYGMVWYGMVWYGMVWYGMVWYDMMWYGMVWYGTHVKISQPVASLQTSRQQVVFARLVTSCQQVWNKLLTTCNNLVDIIRLVTRLFQQDCYNHDTTILLQPCVVNLVTFLLYHDCIRLVRTTL